MRHGTIVGTLALLALMAPAALAQERGHRQEADRFARMGMMQKMMEQMLEQHRLLMEHSGKDDPAARKFKRKTPS